MTKKTNTTSLTNVTGSSLKPERKFKPSKKTWLVLVCLLMVLGIVPFFGMRFFGGLKNYTYDNGRGGKFKLTFYRNAEKKSIGELSSTPAGTIPGSENISDALFAHDVIDKGFSVVLSIIGPSEKTAQSIQNSASCKEVSFEIKLKQVDQPTKVCALSNNGKAIIYLVPFVVNNKHYTATVLLDYDLKDALSDPKKASDVLDKVDLHKYDEVLKKSLGSIEVVN